MMVYALRWTEFLRPSDASISYDDIPWIPVLAETRLGMDDGVEKFDILGISDHATHEEKKQAVRAASLRWHPDKFTQAFGRRLLEKDRGRVMESVKLMSQRINQLKDRLRAR